MLVPAQAGRQPPLAPVDRPEIRRSLVRRRTPMPTFSFSNRPRYLHLPPTLKITAVVYISKSYPSRSFFVFSFFIIISTNTHASNLSKAGFRPKLSTIPINTVLIRVHPCPRNLMKRRCESVSKNPLFSNRIRFDRVNP